MSRKSLWLGLILAIFAAAMLTLPASAKPKKKKVERRSGPPTISLMAEPSVIKACANEGRVQLTTNGRSETGQLRYRWSVNGGRLRGDGPSPIWDLGGAAPGVYQAIVDVDDGDANCVAFSHRAGICSYSIFRCRKIHQFGRFIVFTCIVFCLEFAQSSPATRRRMSILGLRSQTFPIVVRCVI